MSMTDEIQWMNIKEYARLLEKREDLIMQLGMINDDLVNLAIHMTNEDINEAYQLLKSKYSDEYL